LQAYDFPGNIRELKSIVQHAVNLATGTSISVHHLPEYITAAVSAKPQPTRRISDEIIIPLAAIEKDHILKAYHSTSGNKVLTARLLAVGISTLRRKLQSYGLD